MSRHRRPSMAARLLGIFLLAALGATSAVTASPKEYVYLLVRGRILDTSEGRAMPGATVTLRDGKAEFRAVTDALGVFVFERLPVATYEMSVRSATGEVVSAYRPVDPDTLGLSRFEVKLGRGDETTAAIAATPEGVTISAPPPPVRWGRFWKQFAVFAGIALIPAL